MSLLPAELLDNKAAKDLWDAIELYGWKHFSKGGVPAIVRPGRGQKVISMWDFTGGIFTGSLAYHLLHRK